LGFATDCIHAGQEPDPTTGAVTTPIYQTSTYVQEGLGKHKGYEYARTQNPTRRALEKNLAVLEGGADAYCYASGMAATNAVLTLVKSGQRVVVSDNVYGGTHRLFTRVLANYGVEFTFLDASDARAFDETAGAFDLLWIETPTNPLMKVCDIAALAAIAKKRKALLVVDNTFLSPALQRPLALGADIVVHSTTKYLAGHADVVGGALIVDDDALWEELKFFQNAIGAIPGPQDCFLVLRGTKTLALRMDRHCANARAVAGFLDGHPQVARVYFPGLASHPGHDTARQQMRNFGGVVSFELRGGEQAARAFLKGLRLWTLGESLGSVKSLLCQPATMTHASVEPEVRREAGIADGLLRLSVGIEEADDLVADLDRALEVSAPAPARRTVRTA
jgi:cystathionine beta-lyase/cystathionine gamma-synthase